MGEDSKDGKDNSGNSGLTIEIPKSQVPPLTISFHETDATSEPIGMLFMDMDGILRFEGDMAESAKIFFENFLKPMCDDYIKEELKKLKDDNGTTEATTNSQQAHNGD